MKRAAAPNLVIDFDNTFSSVEALDELASIALEDDSTRDRTLKEIRNLTNEGMEGKITFEESLRRRVPLLRAQRKHIDLLIKRLKKSITPSFVRNKKFLSTHAQNIYIISGGFRDFIAPVVKPFGISESHVLANTFRFDRRGNIIGYDVKNPLAGRGGKTEAIRRLQLRGEVYMLGDGYTDYEVRKNGVASKFFAFTENVARDVVIKNADHVVATLDEFLYINGFTGATSFPKNRLKVLLLENIHPDAVRVFKSEGYTIEIESKSLSEGELLGRVRDVSVLGIRSKTEITRRVLTEARRLMVIGAFCVGTNQIDLEECSKKGIAVFNAPYSNTRSVVELAVAEIIMLMRRVFDKSKKLHEGMWDKSAKGSFEIRGKKLGIIGYGNIGSQLSIAAEALGMDVCFYDIVEKLPIGNAVKCTSMNEVLKNSDVVTLHVDGNPRNKNLISAREIKGMKDGAYLINLSRGIVVDIGALSEALKSGKLGGAAVDVFPQEPRSSAEVFRSELQHVPNVILTPHIGGSTEEAQEDIGRFVSEKIIDFVNVGNTYLSVNLPTIQLPELKNAHRLIHIHHNMPGVLANINGVLAKHKINILGQYLKTNEATGYVITDVSREYDKVVVEAMKKIQHTIKFRVLY